MLKKAFSCLWPSPFLQEGISAIIESVEQTYSDQNACCSKTILFQVVLDHQPGR
jgi:hypothetical protein